MQTSFNLPKQSDRYTEGFDDNGHWLPEMAYDVLHDRGVIVQLGQIGPFVERLLNRFVRQGGLVKYRGHWDTTLTFAGMGPLKTIWATPDYVAQLPGFDAQTAA